MSLAKRLQAILSAEAMSKPIIEVRNISKRYELGAIGATRLRDDIERVWDGITGKIAKKNTKEFWAVRDVSFEVQPGEIIGIIGRNGAGKSTLLKILSRITEPTSGEIVMRGRVASLLEVGTGFHGDLTGRENIFLNGAILGMTRSEIKSKLDEIIAFAEVEKFIDTPVKRYSSGMYVRLAFAVAAHLEPEILIVDEVLAVGDQQFQNKCMGKMKDVSRNGRTILFVSHSMMAIQSLCKSGLVLQKGKVVEAGDLPRCIDAYLAMGGFTRATTWTRGSRPNSSSMQFERVDSNLIGAAPSQKLEIDLELKSIGPHGKAFLAADIFDSSGIPIMQALPTLSPFINESPLGSRFKFSIKLPPLVPGMYSVTLWMGSHNTATFDELAHVISFEIVDSPTTGRTFSHSRDHGFLVPESTITEISIK